MSALPFQSEEEVSTAIPRAVQHLERGGLLAYPTETVYGLGSRPLADDVARLAALKRRSKEKPFLLLISGIVMAERFGLLLTAPARQLAERYWPGPLTLVLPGGEGRLPDSLRGPEGGIAVRWTSHHSVARLIDALGMPITSTSANRPGGPTAPGAAALLDTFSGAVEDGRLLVLDGGVLGNVPPSTVIDCSGREPRLIREGAIPRRELRIGAGWSVR